MQNMYIIFYFIKHTQNKTNDTNIQLSMHCRIQRKSNLYFTFCRYALIKL